jgi:hypothetical protein
MVLHFRFINNLRGTLFKDVRRQLSKKTHFIVRAEEVEQNDGDRLFRRKHNVSKDDIEPKI